MMTEDLFKDAVKTYATAIDLDTDDISLKELMKKAEEKMRQDEIFEVAEKTYSPKTRRRNFISPKTKRRRKLTPYIKTPNYLKQLSSKLPKRDDRDEQVLGSE